MRWTLMHKYVGSLFGALITCCGIVLFVSIYYMKVPIEDELDKGIRRMCQVVHMSNESTAQRFAQSAALIADEDSLARAIAEKDHETVSRLGKGSYGEGQLRLHDHHRRYRRGGGPRALRQVRRQRP